MTAGDVVAARALALVGAPFRLHGRDPASGLDCIGLAAVALALPDGAVPTGYSRRASSPDRWHRWFAAGPFLPAALPVRPGDLLLVDAGRGQHHLLVAVAGGHVHAHAAIGRAVFQPGESPWPVLARWRVNRP